MSDFDYNSIKNTKLAIQKKIPNTIKKDAENTGVMGSSMGGLISHYAALKHPDVFGKAGIYSPSFWFSQESISFAKSKEKLKDSEKLLHLLLGLILY